MYNGLVMPSRNSVKQYVPDSMYHVYNRGNNKQSIFKDERDYAVFMGFLKYALLSDSEHSRIETAQTDLLTESQRFSMRREGFADELELVSFCLMPNHFHLLFYQYSQDAISRLMRSIATGYSMYFNKRHNMTGRLFGGVYKAAHISDDSYWQHISRYIHLNPLDIGKNYIDYPYSSYRYFSNAAEAEWVKPELILNGFSNPKEYGKFVADYIPYRKELKELEYLLANT